MKSLSLSVAVCALTLALCPASLIAERKGYITSRPCPYSCRTAGLKKKHCRDWRKGNMCFVEDLRKPPAKIRSKGYVTIKFCPFSCDTAGISRAYCRDWKEGDLCYVEDLRRAPAPVAAPTPFRPANPVNPTVNPPVTASTGNSAECRKMSRYDMARPYINIDRVYQTGNFFKDKVKVRGSVEGICLVEAGVFEEGRKVKSIPVVTTRDFRRYEFEAVVHSTRMPEVRVYNINGDRDVRRIE
ncbi:MAG: hypothetical protein D6719_11315 [Candidatus Dadabacteria bacterium]|nr:MAG: hypothetical protein D6719_11315 [Candidatus Dadabacteria bacterium]